MSNVIIVGVDDRPQSRDAIALATGLAKVTGAELVLAHVHPYDPLAYSLAVGGAASAPLAEESRALLRDAAAGLEPRPRLMPIAASSPPHGLQAVAEDVGAAMIVVGSSHRGPVGRVLAGSHTEAMVAGAPCAVAVAPRGLADDAWKLERITVGFDGGPEAREALRVARELATAGSASVRLVGVAADAAAIIWGPYAYVPDWAAIKDEKREAMLRELDRAAEGEATEVRTGDPVEQLDGASTDADLLVLGSRAYGPVRRVLLGGTSHRVVRHAACPVLVVPRSAAPADATVVEEPAAEAMS